MQRIFAGLMVLLLVLGAAPPAGRAARPRRRPPSRRPRPTPRPMRRPWTPRRPASATSTARSRSGGRAPPTGLPPRSTCPWPPATCSMRGRRGTWRSRSAHAPSPAPPTAPSSASITRSPTSSSSGSRPAMPPSTCASSRPATRWSSIPPARPSRSSAPGYYHAEVGQDTTTFRTYRGGSATMTPSGGATAPVAANQQMVITGGDAPRVESGGAARADRVGSLELPAQRLPRAARQREAAPGRRLRSGNARSARNLAHRGKLRQRVGARGRGARAGPPTPPAAGSGIRASGGRGSTTRRGDGRRITTAAGSSSAATGRGRRARSSCGPSTRPRWWYSSAGRSSWDDRCTGPRSAGASP